MKTIDCILIEDEFPASEILKSYLTEISNWQVKASFENAIDAINYLSNHSVDVIFVDLKLPRLSGISFIKTLEKPPIIVITTAYSEHAIEAFELVVFDYLLKPYSFERFLKTINRINAHELDQNTETNESKKDELEYIIVNENRRNIKLYFDEILYLESQKEYVKIICEERTVKTKTGITKMAEALPDSIFIRIHRSFMVRKDKVDSFSKKQIVVGKRILPIGRFYQKEVNSELDILKDL